MRMALILLALTACTQFPQLDEAGPARSEAADYPTLVPIEPILAQATADPDNTAGVEAELTSRVAALKARAARLKGGIVDPSARARMTSGVTQ